MGALAAIPALLGMGTAATAGLAAGTAVAGAAAVKSMKPKAPQIAAPAPVAPLPDEEEVRRNTRRRAAMRLGKLGSRESTVLDNSSGKLGA
jgi:hypothetical protein